MPAAKVDGVVIHMYKMGTGDCFVLKFMKGDEVSFKMLIDCGVWSGKKTHIQKFVRTLKKDVDNHVDVLVVTHEHKDHVYGFQAAEELFTDGSFRADHVWMGWTEDDDSDVVKQWKREHGQRKRALALAAKEMKSLVKRKSFRNQYANSRFEKQMLGVRETFTDALEEFADLHVDDTFSAAERDYIGDMKGMMVAKQDIPKDDIQFFSPGDIIRNQTGLEGVKIFVLGPPKAIAAVETEKGKAGESFEHNKDVDDDALLTNALNSLGSDADSPPIAGPFDNAYLSQSSKDAGAYNAKTEAWRRIDYDWVFSSGQFALRMNSLTNNLSLALAFEFEDNGKVMLFPGDAEFGSWRSWQDIKWGDQGEKAFGTNNELTTKDLLRRTVFYKVAHHLSHNGTARSVGLDMMTSPDLVAMATLDYQVISNGWKSTMPNQLIVKSLLEKTKGRTIIMNMADLMFSRERNVLVSDVIDTYRDRMSHDERQEFKNAFDDTNPHYIEYKLKV